ncbi:MAG TPA: imidazolonepropionase, partial [Acidobacteriota bacterium]|nr:imidazolonepropionase [Acidobacteriota bacterium]
MPVLENIGMLAACRAEGGQSEIHAIPSAALAWKGERIEWVGPQSELPTELRNELRIDAFGGLVIPGLVDCHTHLAFGGWRSDEFEMRIRGKSYLEIARDGGGILSTVRKTRASSHADLIERGLGFLKEMTKVGVTTVECKSGYGLDLQNEIKQLEVYRRLSGLQPCRIVPTFLGAHAVPPEYDGNRRGYLESVCSEMIPRIAAEKLARFCDVFVEAGAFTLEEGRSVLETGKEHGLAPRIHADQFSDGGGALLAAEVGAISADHLEHASAKGRGAMASRGVLAVSLPLASLYLNQPALDARKWIEEGVRVAVATDFNPGSAPSNQLPLVMWLACHLQRMTPNEVLKGATVIAAEVVQMQRDIGSLEAGKLADFAVVEAPDVRQWMYHFREQSVVQTY